MGSVEIKKYHYNIIDSFLVGFGAFIGLACIGLVAEEIGYMMVIAPFGATAVLLFSMPNSPSARPVNIFAGYLISTLIGLIVLTYTSGDWLLVAIGLGTTIMLMHLFNVMHPAAGANYIIIVQGQLTLSSIQPIVIGLMSLVIIGISINKIRSLITQKYRF